MSTIGKRVLLIDDDEQLVALLGMKLTKAGYEVVTASKADDGYRLGRDETYDAIVLDVLMPKTSGIEICSRLRADGVFTPVLLLSGQTDKDIIVQGLNAGADDYLTKPFQDSELAARIRALLRRHRKAFVAKSIQRCGVMLDVPTRTVYFGEVATILTKKETLLLKRLMAESPDPVSRLALLQDVWGIGSTHASNRLDVYVRRLRKKLAAIGESEYVHTVRSGGYYFGD